MATLTFKGKGIVQNHHLTVPYHALVPQPKKSDARHISLDDNLIIHGDNLKALKALLPTYAGKVKCIYIDPPYNTGNEGWKYNDNVNSPMMQEWLGKVVDREDLTRHDKWLCMMMPRLKLLREFLRDDGVIFVSIDDNEVHHLRMLMNEVFGEENFLAKLVWRGMHTVRNSSKDFNQNAEYILAFAKTRAELIKDGKPDTYLRYPMDKKESYPLDDVDGRGPYKLDPIYARNFYTPYEFKFKNGLAWRAPRGNYPRYSQETLREMEKADRVVFSGKEPKAKRYLKEVQEGVPPDTLMPSELVGFNKDGTIELAEIFGKEEKIFDQPKPTSLIKWLMRIERKIDTKDNVILDSFAGSGTTAHAVLALNKEDGGNRRFILVECEDYADTITAERVRRVITGVPKAKDENLKKGLGGTFSYFELGRPIEVDSILDGDNLPSYRDLARYVFYTATGKEFDEKNVKEDKHSIGFTKEHDVYLIYKPDVEFLKSTALTLERAHALGASKARRRLVFAPTKYLNQEQLDELKIDFAQLPFEIYRHMEHQGVRAKPTATLQTARLPLRRHGS
jgi:adenine-specific DNA-methyltransferase